MATTKVEKVSTRAATRIDEKKRGKPSSRIPGFYRLSVKERLEIISELLDLSEDEAARMRDGSALKIDRAANMVENGVGIMNLPMGLGLNFLVDGRDYIVPMAIEEPSIIAAASKGAMIARKGGGFTTSVDEPVMIGQIQVVDIDDPEAAAEKINEQKQEIIERANCANGKMIERGGGVFDVETRVLDGGEEVGKMLIIHLLMNVCEAMGANAVNSSCEAAAPMIEDITGGRVNLRILSNLADKRLARAEFRIPLENLACENMDGEEVGKRLVEAGAFAKVDPYRATTHNKGIFNGLCAAALALGQDWRAIEAGGHAYAARDGQYRSLSSFTIEDGCLVGKLGLPLQVGWVGGVVNSHPGVKLARKISGVQSARELAALLAAVGLAQNFAACLALSTVGIQKGHMALHARNIALSIGVPEEDIDAVAKVMIERGKFRADAATEIYRELQKTSPVIRKRKDIVTGYATGKVLLYGEHATVYNKPGITTTIDVGLKISVGKDPDGPRFTEPRLKEIFPSGGKNHDTSPFSNAADAALKLYGLDNEPIAIEVASELVPGMGLGSSAAFSVALCRALRRYSKLDSGQNGLNGLFEDVQLLESIFHGNPSGVDAATVISGGPLWFRKGPPREIVPLRIPSPVRGIACIVEPGGRTLDMVRQVREKREADTEAVDHIMSEIGDITTDAAIALGTGDAAEAGLLMIRNHELLVELGVSTPALDRAVEVLMSHGVLGAKMTGSGGGGAVIALIGSRRQKDMIREMSRHFPLVYPFTIEASA